MKKRLFKHYSKRDYKAFIYLMPWLIGLLVLQIYPIVSSLYYSFTDYRIGGTPVWVGLQNYIRLFTEDVPEPQHQGNQPDPYSLLHPIPFWRKRCHFPFVESYVPGQWCHQRVSRSLWNGPDFLAWR